MTPTPGNPGPPDTAAGTPSAGATRTAGNPSSKLMWLACLILLGLGSWLLLGASTSAAPTPSAPSAPAAPSTSSASSTVSTAQPAPAAPTGPLTTGGTQQPRLPAPAAPPTSGRPAAGATPPAVVEPTASGSPQRTQTAGEVVTVFATVFTADMEPAAWLDELRPVTTSFLLQGLEETDATRRPTGTVTDIHQDVAGETTQVYEVHVDTGLILQAVVELTIDGWRVAAVRPLT